VFLYDGAIVPDPDGIITAGHGNEIARRPLPTARLTAGHSRPRRVP